MSEPTGSGQSPPTPDRERSAADPERWRRICAAFDRGVELGEEARGAFLRAVAEAEDDAFAAEVAALLDSDARTGARLDRPLLDQLKPDTSVGPSSGRGSAGSPGVGATDPDGGSDGRDPGPRTGERIGPYRVGPRIGRGGMGDVYLADRVHGDFQQRVALKLLRAGPDSMDLTRRFRAERRILAGLEHPNIARLLGGGVTEDGTAWFSMEYVEGLPITEYCRRHGLDTSQRLTLFDVVCEAVQHAHQGLVVHRDLKPGNILVTPEGGVKLLDFGIAKVISGDGEADDVTLTALRPMTPRYAAPEQVRGEPVTVAIDVYALGVILYELLSGTSPYAADLTARELEQAVLTETPAPPSEAAAAAGGLARRRVPMDLDNICMMALRKEAERRYPSVHALRDDLRRHFQGRAVTATRDTAGYRFRKFVTRHRSGVIGTTAAVLVLTLVTGTLMVRLAAERDRARIEARNAAEIADFLQGLFEVSDPRANADRDVTARELLDEGARRIETELGGEPAVQARMLSVIGNVYRRMGLQAEAGLRLERALALTGEVHGEESVEFGRGLLDLASVRFAVGEDLTAADSLQRMGIDLLSRNLGPDHPDVGRVLIDRAMFLQVTGDYSEGERVAREALTVLRSAEDPAHEHIAEGLNALGILVRRQGRLAEAERLYREALDMRTALLDPSHPDVLITMSNLAIVLEQLGEYDEAEALLRERVRRSRERLGEEHPTTLVALNNLAYLLWRTGDRVGAEAEFRSVVELARRVGTGTETSPGQPALAIFLNNLAVALRTRGDPVGADTLMREALAVNRRVLGDEHPRVAADIANLARNALARGDAREAERLHREALAMRRRLLDPGHPDLAESLVGLGLALRARGTLAQADTALTEALVVRRAALGDESPGVAEALHELGAVRAERGATEEAESLLREAIEIRQAVLGADHPDLAASRLALGSLLRDAGQYEAAEVQLLESHRVRQLRAGTLEEPALQATVEELVELYEVWGRPVEARRYRALLVEER